MMMTAVDSDDDAAPLAGVRAPGKTGAAGADTTGAPALTGDVFTDDVPMLAPKAAAMSAAAEAGSFDRAAAAVAIRVDTHVGDCSASFAASPRVDALAASITLRASTLGASATTAAATALATTPDAVDATGAFTDTLAVRMPLRVKRSCDPATSVATLKLAGSMLSEAATKARRAAPSAAIAAALPRTLEGSGSRAVVSVTLTERGTLTVTTSATPAATGERDAEALLLEIRANDCEGAAGARAALALSVTVGVADGFAPMDSVAVGVGLADAAARRVGVAPSPWHEYTFGPDALLVDAEHPAGSAAATGLPVHVADDAQYCCNAMPPTHTYLYDDDAVAREQTSMGYDVICSRACVVTGHVFGDAKTDIATPVHPAGGKVGPETHTCSEDPPFDPMHANDAAGAATLVAGDPEHAAFENVKICAAEDPEHETIDEMPPALLHPICVAVWDVYAPVHAGLA